MKDLLSWMLLLALVAIMGIYLLGKLSDSQTDKLYARAHLVEVKSDANASWLTHVLPYFLTAAVVIAGAFTVAISLMVLVAGGLAAVGILEYFGLRREVMARSAEQTRLARPIIIQFAGTPRQVYKKLGASKGDFIIDG